MTSKLARNFNRQKGAQDTHFGFIADPLKLPYAKILMEVQQIRVSEAYRRMVTAGAAIFARQWPLLTDALKGLSDHDLHVIDRAFDQLSLDMEARPYVDILGPVYMEIGHKIDRSMGGEFFTPHALCRLLGEMMLGDLVFKPGEIPTANEPASGTGAIVLAAAESLANRGVNPLCMRWTLQDISATSCYGAYLNTTLWGIPATVICGDTLRLTQNWAWRNIHWFNAYPHIPTAADYVAQQKQKRQINAMRQFITNLPEFLGGSQEAI